MKFKIFILLYITTLFQLSGLNAQNRYNFYQIPASLLKNVDAVIRTEQHKFRILSEKKAEYSFKTAITILNKNGTDHAYVSVFYNDHIRIKKLSASIYDAHGNHREVISSSDINDVKLFQESKMYDSDRYKIMNLARYSYPYTIEYEYTCQFDGIINIPGFSIESDSRTSIQNIAYQIVKPKTYELRYKIRNQLKNAYIDTLGKDISYTWSYANIPASGYEAFSPVADNIVPSVDFSPNSFYFQESTGKMDTWENYGKWYYNLNNEVAVLPEKAINDVKFAVAGSTTDLDKIKSVYEFVQNNTRYYNVSIGIGGFKAASSSEVYKYGYGDCKALTNFTRDLLKIVGIQSYPVLINSGSGNDTDISFPGNFFDHVILCVPNNGDTVWLECTSQTNPFGYLGSFTAGRNALLVSDNGGKLVRTPDYNINDNTMYFKGVFAKLDEETTDVKINFKMSGIASENFLDLTELSKNDQQQWVYDNLNIENFLIEKIKIEAIKQKFPIVSVTLNLDVYGLTYESANRLFLNPYIAILNKSMPLVDNERKNDIVIHESSMTIDSLLFEIPFNYKVEYLPQNININNEFGSYERTVTKKGKYLIYIRKKAYFKGTYPKTKYNDFRQFLKSVIINDKEKIVLVKKSMTDI